MLSRKIAIFYVFWAWCVANLAALAIITCTFFLYVHVAIFLIHSGIHFAPDGGTDHEKSCKSLSRMDSGDVRMQLPFAEPSFAVSRFLTFGRKLCFLIVYCEFMFEDWNFTFTVLILVIVTATVMKSFGYESPLFTTPTLCWVCNSWHQVFLRLRWSRSNQYASTVEVCFRFFTGWWCSGFYGRSIRWRRHVGRCKLPRFDFLFTVRCLFPDLLKSHFTLFSIKPS